MKKRTIGVTTEGDAIIERGWKNFAEIEKTGEIVSIDGIAFSATTYVHLKEIWLTHHSYSVDAHIDLNHLYHNGHHIQGTEKGTMVDGVPFIYYEHGDEASIEEDKEILSFMGSVFDVYELHEDYEDLWAFIKINNEICLIIQLEDDEYHISSTTDTDNMEIKELCLSIYKAQNFVELDMSCLIDMNMIDNNTSVKLMKVEREQYEHIKRTKIAKALGIDKVTLYKLDAKVKKGDEKSMKRLMDYVDLYLFKKYFG